MASKEYRKKYYKENKERLDKKNRKYYFSHKSQVQKYQRQWRLEHIGHVRKICSDWKKKDKTNFPWKYTLGSIIQRCENKNHRRYKDYGGRGIICLITLEELKELWFRDKAFEMKQPSIDRIDNDGNYEFSNCQYIELSKNREKNNKTPILQFTKEGKFIKEWPSITQAAKEHNVSIPSIFSNLILKTKTSCGYIWR
jgi:hypothetical protein